jgi:hypothetical protein
MQGKELMRSKPFDLEHGTHSMAALLSQSAGVLSPRPSHCVYKHDMLLRTLAHAHRRASPEQAALRRCTSQ